MATKGIINIAKRRNQTFDEAKRSGCKIYTVILEQFFAIYAVILEQDSYLCAVILKH